MNKQLSPQLRNSFEISFETDQLPLLENFNCIENQLVSIDMGTELLSGNFIEHRTQKIILWLVDTQGGALMRSIRAIQQYPFAREFNFYVKLQDNGKVTEIYSFIGCRFDAIQHSLLSYEPVDESVPNRANSMKLLQLTFAKMDYENNNDISVNK